MILTQTESTVTCVTASLIVLGRFGSFVLMPRMTNKFPVRVLAPKVVCVVAKIIGKLIPILYFFIENGEAKGIGKGHAPYFKASRIRGQITSGGSFEKT
jgi:hypothetical protein